MCAEDTAGDAARIRKRIAELDAERAALSRELVQLTRREPAPSPNAEAPPVTAESPSARKVALFRSLFAGRADVFPVRWRTAAPGSPATRRRVRETTDQVRRVSESGVRSRIRPRHRIAPARAGAWTRTRWRVRGRRVSAPARRNVLVPRRRLRRRALGRGRPDVSRGVQSEAGPRGARAIAVGKRRARVDLFLHPRARARGAATRRAPPNGSHGAPAR